MGHHWDFGDIALIIFVTMGCILVWSWLSREASLTESLMDGGKKKQPILPSSPREEDFRESALDALRDKREDIYDVDNGDINQIRYHCYNIYEYDHVGQLIRGTRYEDDGRMRYYYLYEYDETGLITQLTQFNADGSIEERSAWEHDAEGNVTKQTIYHSDGTVDVYTYG